MIERKSWMNMIYVDSKSRMSVIYVDSLIASNIVWIKSLLNELGLTLREPPLLLCDNVSETQLSLNPVMHSRMKHIAIDLHFAHDFAHRGKLCVAHVHMDDQLANLLTKPLARSRFNLLCGKINVVDGTSILRGRIREST